MTPSGKMAILVYGHQYNAILIDSHKYTRPHSPISDKATAELMLPGYEIR